MVIPEKRFHDDPNAGKDRRMNDVVKDIIRYQEKRIEKQAETHEIIYELLHTINPKLANDLTSFYY